MNIFPDAEGEVEMADGAFDGGAADFAVALGGVAVAYAEEGAFDGDGEVEGCAGDELFAVDVAAPDARGGGGVDAGLGWGDAATGLGVVALAQVLVGVSNGAGNLAWNLGHNDFCPADRAGTYMGVHVMLTGLRGCLAPFFGSWLYLLPGVGRHVFALSALACVVATFGFYHMAKDAPRKPIGRVKVG